MASTDPKFIKKEIEEFKAGKRKLSRDYDVRVSKQKYSESVENGNTSDDRSTEFPTANPDALTEEDSVFYEPPVTDIEVLRREALREAGFTDKQEDILRLLSQPGMTQEEAARILGITRVALERRLMKVRRKLEKIVGIKKAELGL
jgi:predicted DNA-binding protein (UPF0251 family)